jgi:Na+/proline symporter
MAMPADRALLWPILIPVAAALILGTTYSFGTLLVFPALLGAVLTAMGWLLWVVVSGITAFWRRKWRRAASLIVALVLFAPAVWLCARSGDYVHLAIMLPY